MTSKPKPQKPAASKLTALVTAIKVDPAAFVRGMDAAVKAVADLDRRDALRALADRR